MEKLQLTTFKTMSAQNQNAVVALLQLHAACFRSGEPVFQFGQRGLPNMLSWCLEHDILTSTWQKTGEYLCGLDLQRSNIFAQNLCGINLHSCDLRGSNFSGCNLSGANLENADLTSVTMFVGGQRVGFQNEEQYIPSLRHANLKGAKLRSFVVNADWSGAIIEGADLSNASLGSEDLKSTIGEPFLMSDGMPPKKGWRSRRTSSTKMSAKRAKGKNADGQDSAEI
jgi:uncharacterized protein YjbI with pentapeptide repeats